MNYQDLIDIIEEIAEQARRDGNTQEMFVKDWRSFEYGYLRGLTEAAMIMLERPNKKPRTAPRFGPKSREPMMTGIWIVVALITPRGI